MLKREDVFIGVVLSIVSVVFFINTYTFPVTPVQSAGPAFWPRVLTVILFCLSLVLIIGGVIKRKRQKQNANKDYTPKPILKPMIAIAISMLFVALFKKLGFVITTFSYYLAMSLVIKQKIEYKNIKSWLSMLLQSSAIVGLIYFVFKVFLNVDLPSGIVF